MRTVRIKYDTELQSKSRVVTLHAGSQVQGSYIVYHGQPSYVIRQRDEATGEYMTAHVPVYDLIIPN